MWWLHLVAAGSATTYAELRPSSGSVPGGDRARVAEIPSYSEDPKVNGALRRYANLARDRGPTVAFRKLSGTEYAERATMCHFFGHAIGAYQWAGSDAIKALAADPTKELPEM